MTPLIALLVAIAASNFAFLAMSWLGLHRMSVTTAEIYRMLNSIEKAVLVGGATGLRIEDGAIADRDPDHPTLPYPR